MGPFDRFTDEANRVLAFAGDEAMRFAHDWIGTEHLLLGLIRVDGELLGGIFGKRQLTMESAREAVLAIAPRGEAASPSGMTLTPRTKKVIELAIEEARFLGSQHVAPEHLLLALLQEGEGIAAKVLSDRGMTLVEIRWEVQTSPGGRWVWYHDAEGRKRDWYCEDVLAGKMKVEVVFEDDRVLAFHHPDPEAEVHVVVIPKTHVSSLLASELLDPDLVVAMVRAVQEVAKRLGLDEKGFQLRANAAAPGVTPHVHWHVMGPGLPPPPPKAT